RAEGRKSRDPKRQVARRSAGEGGKRGYQVQHDHRSIHQRRREVPHSADPVGRHEYEVSRQRLNRPGFLCAGGAVATLIAMRRLPFFRLGLLFFAHSAVWADAVLVVPFFNQSKSGSVDWIGESFSETIRESLASQGLLLFTRENRVEAYRRLSLRPNAQLTRAS